MPSIDIFLDPKTCREFVGNFNSANHSFKSTVAGQIMSDMALGKSQSSVSTSGKAGADVLNVLHMLNIIGYKASLSGSNLIVSWVF